MAKRQKIALIDAHALIHRAYHALPPMSTRQGVPTNAVYGFTMMLLKVLSAIKPTHVAAAFDVKGPTFRHKAFADYKAQRKPAEEALIAQFDVVREVLAAFNIPIIQKQGYEADDILGTLTARLDRGVKKVIVTGDLDTLQLVDEDTAVFTLKRGVADTILYTPREVRERFGFGPEFVPDYKGLAGDASDNIPGVLGIGEKTARELVVRYGSLEEIFSHIDDLPARVQRRLRGHKREAFSCRKLALIRRDVAVEFSLPDAAVHDFDPGAVREVFERLEFRSLLARIPKSSRGDVQPTLFARAGEGPPAGETGSSSPAAGKTPGVSPSTPGVEEAAVFPVPVQEAGGAEVLLPGRYHVVESEKERRELKERLRRAKLISFDTETDRLGARTSPIVGMSFAFRSSSPLMKGGSTGESSQGELVAYYVPVDRRSVKEWRDVLEDPKIHKTGHNLKYDLQVLVQSGIRLSPIVFDSMIASYLLHPGARAHGLDTLAAQELGHHCIPITALIGEGSASPHPLPEASEGAARLRGAKPQQKGMSEVPMADIARYACEDAEVALRLYEAFAPRIKEQGLTRVLEELEVPLIAVLADMEMAGVKVDAPVLRRLSRAVTRQVGVLQRQIWQIAGREFNINSTQQLRAVLYEHLKLPTVGIARTQSGYSTAAAELNKLAGQHEIVGLIEQYRELTKLHSTYIATLPELIDKQTGRIHAAFNQTVAATGRLSSANPNLQNIPVRTELGQEIRAAFVAERGEKLVKADYSQLELRIAAHLSGDEKMREAFRAGEDIHRATAAWVFGVTAGAVSAAQRRAAKTLNFGVLYGMGPQNFARAAGLSVEEARSFIGRYWKRYEGLAQYRAAVLEQAESLGFVETLFGRRLPVPNLQARDPAVRAAAERAAFNWPIQGTGADILKKAMIVLHGRIAERYPGARLILTVHDELVCEAPAFVPLRGTTAGRPAYTAEGVGRDMRRIMERAVTLDVPLVVDVAVGINWRDLEPAS